MDVINALQIEQNLISHSRTHSRENLFVCDYEEYGQRFAQKSHLMFHKNRHLGIKPHKCHLMIVITVIYQL